MKYTSLRFACISCFIFTATIFTVSASLADVVVSNFDAANVVRFTESASNVSYTGSGDPHIFVPTGSGGLTSATGVAQGPDGNIYVSSHDSGQILKYNGKTGASMGVFVTLPNDYNPGDGMFDAPAAPAHLEFYNNSLYISDNFGGRVVSYPISRNNSGQLQAGAESDTAIGLFAPAGFSFAPNGDMYVSDIAAASVYKVPSGSTTPQPFIGPGAIYDTNGVQTGTLFGTNGVLVAGGNIYVADLYGSQVYKFNSAGAELASAFIPPYDSPMGNFPSDMVLSRDGQSILLAVLGPDHNKTGSVLQFDLNLNQTGTMATGLPAASSIARIYERGDFNFDGVVNAADIVAMETALTNLSSFQSTNHLFDAQVSAIADVNDDGVVNNADLQSLLNLLISGSPSATSVPEPSSILLAAAAFGGLFHTYRRRLKK